MRPRRTHTSNQMFHLPDGTEDNDLWSEVRNGENGDKTITSVWELSDEERSAIVNGANIELTVWGSGTPPVALRTTDVPLGKAPPSE